MGMWIFWLVVGAGFMIAEVMSLSMICFYAGIGGFAATGCALAGYGWVECIVTFLAVTAILYVAIYRWRGKILRYLHKGGSHSATGMDALIGRTGKVEDMDQLRVRIDGDYWQVRPVSSETVLAAGENVRVVGYDSIILTVERI